jgi:adenylate cyclase
MWGITLASAWVVHLVWSFSVVGFEKSSHYVEAAVASGVAMAVFASVAISPGVGSSRVVDRWAAGHQIDRAQAMKATYRWSRGAGVRGLWFMPVCDSLLFFVVGAVAGASGSRLVQYGIVGAAAGIGMNLIGMHTTLQGALRPARAALGGDTGIGDSLPRTRPTFGTWLGLLLVGCVFAFSMVTALLAIVLDRGSEQPLLAVLIAGALTLGFALPITISGIVSPSLQPIRDLASGANRVAAGDYGRRLPVVQDDDLGALAASFNRMQAGLAERQRLQAAFGTYVDPALAARLLEQGDDVFSGERREVTVMFVDVRDFTPFAEANTAEDTVTRLNALFEIVVPAVVKAGGHVNKFLGDWALAVFGAPNDLADHSDAAVSAAVKIQRLSPSDSAGSFGSASASIPGW